MPHDAGGGRIRPSLRLGIYVRDRWSCVWCEAHAFQDRDVLLTLDHLLIIRPKADNSAGNMVAACWSCNSRRGALSLYRWIRKLPDPEAARRRYRNAVRRRVDRKAALQLHRNPTPDLRWLRNRTRMSFGADHFMALDEAEYYRQKEAEEALDRALDAQDRMLPSDLGGDPLLTSACMVL